MSVFRLKICRCYGIKEGEATGAGNTLRPLDIANLDRRSDDAR